MNNKKRLTLGPAVFSFFAVILQGEGEQVGLINKTNKWESNFSRMSNMKKGGKKGMCI